jgi:2-methylisocitrate lyase-like PEP mutase family enzyme
MPAAAEKELRRCYIDISFVSRAAGAPRRPGTSDSAMPDNDRRLELPRPGSGALLAPGVYDALSALIAEEAGAKACYLSGAAVSYTQYALPDLGFADLSRIVDVAGRIVDRVRIPIIVDADTGFGNALNVARTVRALESAGAAAIQIEDQAMPKRCGHLAGKSLVAAGEMVGKIEAALDARRSAKTLLIARTDAIAVEGFEAALERAARYAEAGADVLFIEALRSEAEMRAAAQRFKGGPPLMANMVEGGRTPLRTLDQLAGLGFSLVIMPGALARAFAFMAREFLKGVVRDGGSAAFAGRMLSFEEINRLVGLDELLRDGARFDPASKRAAE